MVRKPLVLVKPALLLSESLMIVGSSPDLLGKNLGRTIDSFDDVVRFNRAPTAGFETDVGAKITLRVVNSHVALNIPMGAGWDPLGQPADFIPRLRNTRILCWGPLVGFDLSSHIHGSNFIHMPEMTNPAFPGAFNGPQPGTSFSAGFGFVMLCLASGLAPHVCGFIMGTGTAGHYWEKAGPESGCHDRSMERETLAKLRDEGKIIICS